jgi:hypothetical protein
MRRTQDKEEYECQTYISQSCTEAGTPAGVQEHEKTARLRLEQITENSLHRIGKAHSLVELNSHSAQSQLCA